MSFRKWRLEKEQRIQIKAMICILGIALLVILLLGEILATLLQEEENVPQPSKVSVIQKLTNVWILDAAEDRISIFREGNRESYPLELKADRDKNITDDVAEDVAENVAEDVADDVAEDAETSEKEYSSKLADITLTDGKVTDILVKNTKIHGRILRVEDDELEVEGYGTYKVSPDYRAYRIYRTPAMESMTNLPIGYDFADLVLEEGDRVCGILFAREEAMEQIRVLLRTDDFAQLYHHKVELTPDTDFVIEYGENSARKQETFPAGTEIVVEAESPYLSGGWMRVTPVTLTGKTTVRSIHRNMGNPGYRGSIEIREEPEGLVIINELPLEEYLYAVIPSEMPSSYPLEALKAQAVCARTYAYQHMLHAGYPAFGAHVDDGTGFQVYHNLAEQENTTRAVQETYGMLLYTSSGEPAQTYYYSTSCGIGTNAEVWKNDDTQSPPYLQAREISHSNMEGVLAATGGKQQNDELSQEAFSQFITSKNVDDFEVSESWYRWSYQVKKCNPEVLYQNLRNRYEATPNLVLTLEGEKFLSLPIKSFSQIRNLYIAKRGAGGVADELVLETDQGTYKVISEYTIRFILCDGNTQVCRQDGTEATCKTLLPSAFFVISTSKETENVVGYTLSGGGFGHGVGMSQNGAKQMALEGYHFSDILSFFFHPCSIQDLVGE